MNTILGVFVDLGARVKRRSTGKTDPATGETVFGETTVHQAKCGLCGAAAKYDINNVPSMLAHIEKAHEAAGHVERYTTGDGELRFRLKVR